MEQLVGEHQRPRAPDVEARRVDLAAQDDVVVAARQRQRVASPPRDQQRDPHQGPVVRGLERRRYAGAPACELDSGDVVAESGQFEFEVRHAGRVLVAVDQFGFQNPGPHDAGWRVEARRGFRRRDRRHRRESAQDLGEHALGRMTVWQVEVLLAQPAGVQASLQRLGGVGSPQRLQLGEDPAPGAVLASVCHVAVVAVQSPPLRVLLDVGGEEDDRPVQQSEVEGRRGVVGDQHIDRGQRGGELVQLPRREHPNPRAPGGPVRIVAEPERMRAHQQRAVAALGPRRDPVPLGRARNRGVGSTVAPGRRIEHD